MTSGFGDDLTAFQRDMLYVLVSTPRGMLGASLASTLSDVYGKQVDRQRVYQNLDACADVGYAERNDADKRWCVTEQGRQAVIDHLTWATENLNQGASQ
jgi:DNA-binding PadR family transcriptional regulator